MGYGHLLLVVLLVLPACHGTRISGQPDAGPDPLADPDVDERPDPAPEPRDTYEPDPLPEVDAPLDEIADPELDLHDPIEEDPGNPYSPLDYLALDLCTEVAAIDISALGLTAPNTSRRVRWSTFLGYVLAGDWATAYAYNASTMDLQVYVVRDTGATPGRDYVIVHDDANGEGIYVLAVTPDNPLLVQVPYPLEHTGTLEQGCSVMRGNTTRGNGWALLIGGTARCVTTTLLPCDGTTVECTGGTPEDFRMSDVAHNPNLIYQVVHDELMTRDGSALAVQLQGQSDATGAHAIISDGTTFDGTFPVGISVLVRNFLRVSIPAWASALRSCNDPSDASSYTSDCQVTNVQGRETNGSTNLCSLDATASADRFVVLEQSPAMRGSTYHDELTDAVMGLFH